MNRVQLLIIVAITAIMAIANFSCNQYKKNTSHQNISNESIESGEKLAKQYCQSCHTIPDPGLLNAITWEKGILPNMGPRLGIFRHGLNVYRSFRGDRNLDSNFYPSKPMISDDDWQHIIDYYTSVSPDTMPAQKKDRPIKIGLSLFQPIEPSIFYPNAATSFININSKDLQHYITLSDVMRQSTYFLNDQLTVVDSLRGTGSVVDIESEADGMVACDIGQLNPNNGKFGKIRRVEFNKEGEMEGQKVLIDSLQRPVQALPIDLNNDGKLDYIACEFGFLTGALSWFENKGNDQFIKHVLRPLPGSIKVYVNDYNHDGLPDLWVLFAQGEEGIYLFTNKGHGQFDSKEVLRFPPMYGSSSFELADFNKDGYPDIVYTCGDNADYSVVLKPYHGVYIFINDGKNNFTQKYFYPINGCYKAIARDFDGDGDLDIATISFFADYEHQPEEGFVYLENHGNYNFAPFSIEETKKGRWLTMAAGDIDGDGRIDLILGNFCIGPTQRRSNYDWKKGPPILVLKNTGKK